MKLLLYSHESYGINAVLYVKCTKSFIHARSCNLIIKKKKKKNKRCFVILAKNFGTNNSLLLSFQLKSTQ